MRLFCGMHTSPGNDAAPTDIINIEEHSPSWTSHGLPSPAKGPGSKTRRRTSRSALEVTRHNPPDDA
jgi:hypothetical protein